jgi:hypothetical protein
MKWNGTEEAEKIQKRNETKRNAKTITRSGNETKRNFLETERNKITFLKRYNFQPLFLKQSYKYYLCFAVARKNKTALYSL